MRRLSIVVLFMLAGLGAVRVLWRAPEAVSSVRRVHLPLVIETNVGQAPPEADFVVHQRGAVLLLSSQGVTGWLPGAEGAPVPVELQFGGAADVAGQVDRPLRGVVHYLLGSDRSRWIADVATSERVVFAGVYPGVDLAWWAHDGVLEYDFIVAPGADPSVIRVSSRGAVPKLHEPTLYQARADGRRQVVAGGWRAVGTETHAFWVGEYDRQSPLVIDPVLDFSTYFGGSGDDFPVSVAVDSTGGVYVAGKTLSTNYPTLRPYQAMRAGFSDDGFLTKLSDGSVDYSTYFGGSGRDEVAGVAVNSAGEAYLAGYTESSNFPVASALQGTSGGNGDAFFTRFNAAGSALVHSTYFGGTGSDSVRSLQLAGTQVFATGSTSSTDLPLALAAQSTHAGGINDAFVVTLTLTASGGTIDQSTYLGGSGSDEGHSIAVDATGIYVTGYTDSANFPVVAAFQSALKGSTDAFVAKFGASGAASFGAVAYSTYLGGDDIEQGNGIALDGAGGAYVVGLTQSANFPTANPIQSGLGGTRDAFLSHLAATGATLDVSTYWGGTGLENALAVAAVGGVIHLTGYTSSLDLPTRGAVQSTHAGNGDVFLSTFQSGGASLAFSTYLGGTDSDTAVGVAVDPVGDVWITGEVRSTNFPTRSPIQGATAGGAEAFVALLSFADAGLSDAGIVDAGIDAGTPDAGPADAGMADAGRIDAGMVDAGTVDAGTLDAGVAPRFLNLAGEFALCGDMYAYQPNVAADGPVTYELRATSVGESIPEGLQIDSNTGALHWSIPARAVGQFKFQIVARANGYETAQQVVLDVTCRILNVGCGCTQGSPEAAVWVLGSFGALRLARRRKRQNAPIH